MVIPLRSLAVLGLLVASSLGCDFSASGVRPPISAELARSIGDAERAVTAKPDDAELRLELAELYVRASRIFEATDQFKAATDTAPRDPRARIGLTRLYLDLGYFNRAFEELRQCLEANPESVDCLLEMAGLLERDGSELGMKEARKIFARVLAIAPAHTQRRVFEAKIQDIDKRFGPPGAEPPTVEATAPPSFPPPSHGTAAPPDHPPTGGATPAAPPGVEVGELNPFGIAISRAMNAAAKGDAPGAEAGFRDALKIAPKDVGARAGLAEALFHQQKIEEAVSLIEQAYKDDPKDPIAQWVYGMVMIKTRRDLKGAIGAWRDLAKQNPDYAEQLGVNRTLEQIERMVQGANAHPPTPAPKTP